MPPLEVRTSIRSAEGVSIYEIAERETRGIVHLKTAGTSYLEALRTPGVIVLPADGFAHAGSSASAGIAASSWTTTAASSRAGFFPPQAAASKADSASVRTIPIIRPRAARRVILS